MHSQDHYTLFQTTLTQLRHQAGSLTPPLDRLLQVHALNLSAGLQCDGLQEDDIKENQTLPPRWQEHQNQMHSFRYTLPSQKDHVFFKVTVLADVTEVLCARMSHPDQLLEHSLPPADITPHLCSEYHSAILTRLAPPPTLPLGPNPDILKKTDDSFLWGPRQTFEPVPLHSHRPMAIGGPQDLGPMGVGPRVGGNPWGGQPNPWGGQPNPWGGQPNPLLPNGPFGGGIRHDPVGPVDPMTGLPTHPRVPGHHFGHDPDSFF